MIRALALSVLTACQSPADHREWLTAKVNGQIAQVYGWRDSDGRVRYHPEENPHLPSLPPAPPEVQGLGSPGRPQGESPNLPSPDLALPDGGTGDGADLPAYALNGVVEEQVPRERVIYTNVPSLAPKLAREYGVEVRTEGAPPEEYPEADATRIFIGPIVAVAAAVLVALRFKRP